MSEHDGKRIKRVAEALAEAEGYEAPRTGHYTLAAAALQVLAPELEREPCPKPEPRTEWVPWWEAVGRRHPLGEVLASVRADEGDVRFYGPDGSWICDLDGEDDGKVEVLAKDGAE